jgi:hypothetical protein
MDIIDIFRLKIDVKFVNSHNSFKLVLNFKEMVIIHIIRLNFCTIH